METIQHYLKSKQYQWSKTTLKSESSRLVANSNVLHQEPMDAFLALSKTLQPYAVKTTMIRLADFKDFCGDRTWRNFIRNNRKLFQNAYTKERLDISYYEAKEKIKAIPLVGIRELAEELLVSGARISELLSHKKGRVVGKGGRVRDLFMRFPDKGFEHYSYGEIYQELKKVGLKPHTLRKLAATHMVDLGFKEADLMRVMGWSSIATAACYLQPRRDDEIRRRLLE